MPHRPLKNLGRELLKKHPSKRKTLLSPDLTHTRSWGCRVSKIQEQFLEREQRIFEYAVIINHSRALRYRLPTAVWNSAFPTVRVSTEDTDNFRNKYNLL